METPGGLPAHLNLARFLSNSCFSRWKSWMYFIWGHKATREVKGVSAPGNGQAVRPGNSRSLSTLPAGHPTTPKGTQGLSSPPAWSCSSQLRVSSLPRDSEAGSPPSPCT